MKLLLLISSMLLSILTHAQYSIKISPINPNVYLYTSYRDVGNYKNIDANAVVVVSEGEAILFDTPWDSTQAEQLITFVENDLKKKIKLAIITHAHVDRIGSIRTIHEHNIPTYCYQLTAIEASKRNWPIPRHIFREKDTTFTCGDIDIVAYHPGAGHTIDNIVLYIPSKQFLYGGCFIKSGGTSNIGNTTDADVLEWPESVKRMQKRFATTGIKMVIPGHGSWEYDNAIDNTLMLLQDEQKGNY